MPTTLNINIIPGREYLITSPQMAQISISYNGVQVAGPNMNNRFIAAEGVNTLVIDGSGNFTGSLTITEQLRNFYDNNDGQAGTWSYHPNVEKWISKYSYIPESFSMVGNRLVTFKNGNIYVHDSAAYNTFFGQVYDSVIAFPINEGGNTIKFLDNIAIEGNTPDRVHIRTEVPYVQSSDLVKDDFRLIEGVNYSSIYRDRLSPNTSGTVTDKLYKGDSMIGEIGKMMLVYTQPSTMKELKFVNVAITPSSGQIV